MKTDITKNKIIQAIVGVGVFSGSFLATGGAAMALATTGFLVTASGVTDIVKSVRDRLLVTKVKRMITFAKEHNLDMSKINVEVDFHHAFGKETQKISLSVLEHEIELITWGHQSVGYSSGNYSMNRQSFIQDFNHLRRIADDPFYKNTKEKSIEASLLAMS